MESTRVQRADDFESTVIASVSRQPIHRIMKHVCRLRSLDRRALAGAAALVLAAGPCRVHAQTLYIGSNEGYIYKYDANSGAPVTDGVLTTSSGFTTGVALLGNHIYSISGSGSRVRDYRD